MNWTAILYDVKRISLSWMSYLTNIHRSFNVENNVGRTDMKKADEYHNQTATIIIIIILFVFTRRDQRDRTVGCAPAENTNKELWFYFIWPVNLWCNTLYICQAICTVPVCANVCFRLTFGNVERIWPGYGPYESRRSSPLTSWCWCWCFIHLHQRHWDKRKLTVALRLPAKTLEGNAITMNGLERGRTKHSKMEEGCQCFGQSPFNGNSFHQPIKLNDTASKCDRKPWRNYLSARCCFAIVQLYLYSADE